METFLDFFLPFSWFVNGAFFWAFIVDPRGIDEQYQS
jgi:hypothetical protein